jgi:hypothetical protein
MWMDKRLVQLMSTIHDATVVNTGKKEEQTWKYRNLILLSSTINS